MGCNVLFTTCQRNVGIVIDTNSKQEIFTSNSPVTNTTNPSMELSVININPKHMDAKPQLQSSSIIKSQGTWNLNLNRTKFINEKKSKITDYYDLKDVIGEGAFGRVKRCQHKITKEIVAVKMIRKVCCNNNIEGLLAEIDILKTLDHPNILKIFEFYQDKMYYYLVTELCTGGMLFDKIIEMEHFSEPIAAIYLKQILSAVCYCHNQGIMHRDLKPENILLKTHKDDKHIKIIDFGTSVMFQTDKMLTKQAGTAFYIAPEVIGRKYTYKADIWSAGIILYIMITGKPPFTGENEEEIFSKTLKMELTFSEPEWQSVSKSCIDLISKMLCKDPVNRISSRGALEHEWIKELNKEKMSITAALPIKNLKLFTVIY